MYQNHPNLSSPSLKSVSQLSQSMSESIHNQIRVGAVKKYDKKCDLCLKSLRGLKVKKVHLISSWHLWGKFIDFVWFLKEIWVLCWMAKEGFTSQAKSDPKQIGDVSDMQGLHVRGLHVDRGHHSPARLCHFRARRALQPLSQGISLFFTPSSLVLYHSFQNEHYSCKFS